MLGFTSRVMSHRYVGRPGGGAAWRASGQCEREGAGAAARQPTPDGCDPRGTTATSPRTAEENSTRVIKFRVKFGERHNAWMGEMRMAGNDTVGNLKKKLAGVLDIPQERQRMRFLGSNRQIPMTEDDKTLEDAGLVWLMKRSDRTNH